MNCFQIVKSVLDDTYVEIPGSASERDAAIRTRIEELRKQYRHLWNGASINYRDPVTRFAYVYVYVTSHANLVCQVIKRSKCLRECFQRQGLIHVSCIGGGPGSDLLGILKYIEQYNIHVPDKIKCYLVDKEQAWSESWSDVDEKVNTDIPLSTYFMPIDVSDDDSWAIQKKYLRADLFTMIYFLSELYSCREKVGPYFEHLFREARAESLYLFLDNRDSAFYSWFDDLCRRNGVQIVDSQEYKMQMPCDEEKTDLGEYFDKFSSPKLEASVAFRVGIKE